MQEPNSSSPAYKGQEKMNTVEMEKQKFSFFKAPISNTAPSGSITIEQVYNLIKGDTYKEITNEYRELLEKKDAHASEYKCTKFDYVTFGGEFSKRSDKDLIARSGYMVLDIDKQQNIEAIRQQLINDDKLSPILVFVSPSGNGIKAVVQMDNEISDKSLKDIWNAINNYLKIHYSNIIQPDGKGNYIDPSGTDISRACFLCHDENIFFNNKSIQND
jgi:transcriptional regulator of heat shock response